jgi:hypothetical protein
MINRAANSEPHRNRSNAESTFDIQLPNEAILDPHAEDVLLGRGKAHDSHPGNVVYRDLVNRYEAVYNSTNSRFKKSSITHEIMRAIVSRGGRFLEFNVERRHWIVVEFRKARVKVAQALRFKHRRRAPNEEDQSNEQKANTSDASDVASDSLDDDAVDDDLHSHGHENMTAERSMVGESARSMTSMASRNASSNDATVNRDDQFYPNPFDSDDDSKGFFSPGNESLHDDLNR